MMRIYGIKLTMGSAREYSEYHNISTSKNSNIF